MFSTMRNFFLKIYLKKKLRVLRTWYFLKQSKKNIFAALFFFKSFYVGKVNAFEGLTKTYKFFFVFTLAVVFLGSGFLIQNVYSQDLAMPSVDSGQTNTNPQPSSSLPSNYVQDEFEQMMSLGNNIVQGQGASNGNQATSGLLDFTSSVDAYLYTNNPVSVVGYTQYYAQTHGIETQANAQAVTGTGYNALAPVIPIWDIFRNLSYLLIIIIIVAVGFIIIFGGKYGQTEVTVISSIPKILIALILITFSYPLCGFAVDIANLGTNLIVSVFAPAFVSYTSANASGYFPGQYPVPCSNNVNVTVETGITPSGNSGQPTIPQCEYAPSGQVTNNLAGDFNVFRLMAPIIQYQNWNVANGNQEKFVQQLIKVPTNIGILDVFLDAVDLTPFGIPAYLAIVFVLDILMLYIAIKIVMLIITSFVRIVMTTMFSPLRFVMYPLNGGDVFWNFVKSILAPAVVFPMVFALMFIAAILAYGPECQQPSGALKQCAGTGTEQGPWYIDPSKANITNFNDGPAMLVDTVSPEFMWNIVALGIIIAIPSVGKQIDEAFKVEVNRHIEAAGSYAGQRAQKIAQQLPVIGGLLGRF
jgi:hypothetical protein